MAYDSDDLAVLDTADDDSEIGTAEGDAFHVDSESAANWLVRQIVESRTYADRVRQWAKDEVRRAERDEERLMYLYGDQLRRWCQGELASRGNRRRSVHLPAGRVGFRRTSRRLVVQDEAALADWCGEHAPDALTVRAEANGSEGGLLSQWLEKHLPNIAVRRQVTISEIRRFIDATGELPAGVELDAAAEKFFVG